HGPPGQRLAGRGGIASSGPRRAGGRAADAGAGGRRHPDPRARFRAVRISSGTSAAIARTESPEKPVTLRAGPAASAATAPHRFDRASTPPWADARVSPETAEPNSAEAATVTNDQPRPSRKSETTIHAVSAGRIAPMTSEATRIQVPAAMVRRGPSRSARWPTTGENANMPRTCRLMVIPIIVIDPPWWARWTGVAVMTPSITPWAVRIAMTANRATGRPPSSASIGLIRPDAFPGGAGVGAAYRARSRNGSGRSQAKTISPATARQTVAMRNAPA